MAKSIGDYKKDYEEARARGDAAGMKAANDGANAIRTSLGLQTQSAHEDIAKFEKQGAASTAASGGGSGKTASTQTTQRVDIGKKQMDTTRGTSAAGGTTSRDVLELGKGPLSAAGSVSAVQQPVQQQVSVTDSPEYRALLGQLDQLQQQAQKEKEDYSEYVRQLQEAAKEKSLAELEAAYKKNVNAIDAAREQITPQYTAAKNQVAGQAAVSRKNWQETAAAMGLNSGAAGQSDIAQNVALQNGLADLDRAESADLAALELQRTQAETDYNAAIAQAEAAGDYELAAALYQEKVRAGEAARADQTAQFQQLLARLQFEHGVNQDALAQQNWELNRGDTLAQQGWQNKFSEDQAGQSRQDTEFNKLLTLVSSFAESTGDYTLFDQFGFTPEQIAAWNKAWAEQHALELQQAQAQLTKLKGTGSGTASGGSGKSTSAAASGGNLEGPDYAGLFAAAQKDRLPENYIAANYKKFGFTSSNGLAKEYWNWVAQNQQNQRDAAEYEGVQVNERTVTPAAQGLMTDLTKYYHSAEDRLDRINRELAGKSITENDYLWLLQKCGLL